MGIPDSSNLSTIPSDVAVSLDTDLAVADVDRECGTMTSMGFVPTRINQLVVVDLLIAGHLDPNVAVSWLIPCMFFENIANVFSSDA